MESTAAEAGAPACGDSSGGTSKCRKQRTVSASSSSPPESPDSPGAEGPGRRPASVFKLSASTTPLGSISFFPPSEGHESGLCASPHGALRDPCSDGLNEPSRRRGDCSPFSVDRGALGGAPTCSLFALREALDSLSILLQPVKMPRVTKGRELGVPSASAFSLEVEVMRLSVAQAKAGQFHAMLVFPASSELSEVLGPCATRRAVRRPPDACSGGGVGVLAGGLQDAEIAQLSIREAEEDSALSGFVLGSVIEKNTSSADAHATPAPCPPQAASVAPPSDSYPPGSSGPLSFLPSNAAIEAPFGFPKAVHRSLLPCHSRRGADDNAGTPGGLRPKTGPTGATAASSFSDRGSTSVSGPGAVGKALAAEIENENLHILSRMQPHEIREAREEILQRFGAERFAALQRRALRRARAKCSGEHQEQNGNAEATRGAAAGRAARGERQQLQNEDAARLSAFPRENRTEESQTRLQAGGSAPAASPVPPSSSCASSTQSSVFALPGGRQCVLEWSLEPRRALAAAAARTPA
ncbi:RPAP1 family protein [Besnoitia besnoiti]|uniref:RPAP1 family protein n=1 Tax=Besnoitia besnoiti TaxID=94643 RepID=A0A2A9M5R0_BESBE|nr:RPAP1 family protein [Besnoitia besnoiti]PFH30983.1 RPAP1 family protein [Besnoitia besnoiti]